MKNLLFVLFCLGISFSSSAQYKNYTANVYTFTIDHNCYIEGGLTCDARFNPIINDKQHPTAVLGYRGRMGCTAHESHIQERLEKKEFFLGRFKSDDEVKLAFKIWEDDCGESWKFDKSCSLFRGDDDYGNTPTIVIKFSDFKKLSDGSFDKSYEIVHEKKGDGKGAANAGYRLNVNINGKD